MAWPTPRQEWSPSRWTTSAPSSPPTTKTWPTISNGIFSLICIDFLIHVIVIYNVSYKWYINHYLKMPFDVKAKRPYSKPGMFFCIISFLIERYIRVIYIHIQHIHIMKWQRGNSFFNCSKRGEKVLCNTYTDCNFLTNIFNNKLFIFFSWKPDFWRYIFTIFFPLSII